MKKGIIYFVAGIMCAFCVQMVVSPKSISPIDAIRYQYECVNVSSDNERDSPVSYICNPNGLVHLFIRGREATKEEWQQLQKESKTISM